MDAERVKTLVCVIAEVIDDLVEALGLADAVWGDGTSDDDSDEDPEEFDRGDAAVSRVLSGLSSTTQLSHRKSTSSANTQKRDS